MTAAEPSLVMRPHPLFVLLQPIRQYVWIVAAGVFALLASRAWGWLGLGGAPGGGGIVFWMLVVLLVRFVWAVADWATRRYGMSGGQIWAERGVLNRRRDELPFGTVRTMAVVKPIEQRVFGIGSVGFASAGTAGYEVVWSVVGRADARLKRAREALTESGLPSSDPKKDAA